MTNIAPLLAEISKYWVSTRFHQIRVTFSIGDFSVKPAKPKKK